MDTAAALALLDQAYARSRDAVNFQTAAIRYLLSLGRPPRLIVAKLFLGALGGDPGSIANSLAYATCRLASLPDAPPPAWNDETAAGADDELLGIVTATRGILDHAEPAAVWAMSREAALDGNRGDRLAALWALALVRLASTEVPG